MLPSLLPYSPMRLAIVADWLVTFGGAEHVLAALHELFPDAPLFTTVARTQSLGPLQGADIRTTWLQSLYRFTRQHQILLPWMPRAIEGIDLGKFDVVVSSSHAIAKGVIPPSHALHLCYCHTPMRYAWEMEEEYLRDFRVPRLLRPIVKRELMRLRRWDLTTAKRVDVFLANSTATSDRIRNTYGRNSIIIPPPVSPAFFDTPLTAATSTYFLAIGRMVPYKRFDLLIEVANALRLPLKIAGTGQDAARLRRLAGPTVEFLGFVPEADLPALYSGAKALLFPQEEDAGIVPLEAEASGTPVIAYRAGGAIDSVREGETGIFFNSQSAESVIDALRRFETHTWNPEAIRRFALSFRTDHFQSRIREEIVRAYQAKRAGTFTRD